MSQAKELAWAKEVIGHQFNDPDLLHTSLTHASVADSRLKSNERLEFLGDAVLDLIVCDELYRRFGDWLEGDLTKVKSVVVSGRTCAKIADEIGLAKLLILGNGIDRQSNLPMSVRGAVYESVIGAVFIDGGLDAVRPFVLRTLAKHIDRCSESQIHDNFKSALQQYTQRHMSATPHYESLDEQGPDHSKCFKVAVVIAGRRYPGAWGPNKKEAEQEAARLALEALQSRRADTSS